MKTRSRNITLAAPDKTLAEINAVMDANFAAGRSKYAGLTSSEIGKKNRAVMFGENDEAMPDADTWARVTD